MKNVFDKAVTNLGGGNIMKLKGWVISDDQAKKMLQAAKKLYAGVFFDCNRYRDFSCLCTTKISSDNPAWNKLYWCRVLHNRKEITERSGTVKIVVLNPPKFLRGILKTIFKVKK